MSLRHFDQSTEAVAATWRATVSTSETWSPRGTNGAGGICEGYYVTSTDGDGFLKPTKTKDLALPIAAHEKIAADLAHSLALPVPPAILKDMGNKAPVRYCVISKIAFTPPHKWEHVARVPISAARLLARLSNAASAITVFDTWLDNRDRINGGNLIVSESHDGAVLRCAYIDFAHSMTYGWGDNPRCVIDRVIGPFPGSAPINANVLGETVSAIENLNDSLIVDVVERIPEGFLPTSRRECIIKGLLERRKMLRAAITNKFGAIP